LLVFTLDKLLSTAILESADKMGKATSGISSDLPPYRDEPGVEDAVSLHTTRADDDMPDFITHSARDIGLNTLAEPPPYSDLPSRQPLLYTDVPATIADHEEQISQNNNIFAHAYQGEVKHNSNGSTIIWNDEYDKFPDELFTAVKNWGKIPPVKMVRLLGTHKQTTKKEKDKSSPETVTKTVTDFDIKLRLTEYLFTHLGESAWRQTEAADHAASTYRGTILKRKATVDEMGAGFLSTRGWVEQYCQDKAKLKT
jgi:hypothetical protein